MPLLPNMVRIAITLLTTTSIISTPASTPEPQLGQEPIHAVEAGETKTVAGLIARHADLEARNDRQQTPLLIAAHANNIGIARLLIESGADVNARDDMEDNAYLYAGASGFKEILKLTLAHGADVNLVDFDGVTPLQHAQSRGYTIIADMLIAAGGK